MEIDLRFAATLIGVFISVVSSFVIVKQRLLQVSELLNELKKDHETRLRELDRRCDLLETSVDLSIQKQNVLSNILSPSALEKNHRTLERLTVMAETNQKRIEHMEAIHNGSHRYTEKPHYQD